MGDTTKDTSLTHKTYSRLGAWKEWDERPEGLHVKGTMTLGTRDAQEAHALAKEGALTGLSIGWQPIKETRDAKGVRNVTEASLFEGSLVTVPMNPKTSVTSIKSITNARDIAEMLQASGLSGRQARKAAGAAWHAINSTDDEADADAELAAILTASAKRIATIRNFK